MPAEAQHKMASEAWRVGNKDIYVDSSAPLPWNFIGVMKRFFEIAFGLEHYPQFKAYVASGGILGILQAVNLDEKIVHQELFSQNASQMVVVAH